MDGHGRCTRKCKTSQYRVGNSVTLLGVGCAAYFLFTRALFHPGLIDGHDSMAYPARLVEFSRSGFPPLWAPDLSGGRGQPLFEFCPPLIYAVALPFWKLGAGLACSLQIALVVLIAVGALSVFGVGRQLGFSRWASLGASVAWLWAPYQSIDLYVSVRMAEMSALCVAPLGLYALLAWPWPFAAFALALLPLAHNAIALLTFPVFIVISSSRGAGRCSPRALAGAVGLSAYFWLPGLFEMQYVRPELLRTDFFDYHGHFIWFNQLVWGHWQFGYSPTGMDYSLGLPHIALAIGGIVYAFRDRLRTSECSSSDTNRDAVLRQRHAAHDWRGLAWLALSRLRRGTPARTRLAFTFAAASIIGAFLALGYSAPIWDHIPILQYFQFPWRTLALPGLFLPLLSLWAFEAMFHVKRGQVLIILTVALLIAVNIQHAAPKDYIQLNDSWWTPANIAASGYESTTRGEYQPRDDAAWSYLRGPTPVRRIGKIISLSTLLGLLLAAIRKGEPPPS